MKNDTFNTNETYVSPIVGIAQVVGNIYKPYTGTYARVYLNGSKIFDHLQLERAFIEEKVQKLSRELFALQQDLHNTTVYWE